MQRYARKVLERLRTELSKGSATDDWLLRKLRENGWWLRAADARDQLLKLSASSDPAGWLDPFYLRDIRPEVDAWLLISWPRWTNEHPPWFTPEWRR